MSDKALTIKAPFPAPDSIKEYLREVKRHPILSESQETELARRFRNNGDLEAAKVLVLSHLRLVISLAKGQLGYGLPLPDLIQEGNVGLMKAVRRFDPEKGVRLVSFAVHWIKAEINEYIVRNWRIVKIATTKAHRKLFFNLRRLKKDHRVLNTKEVKNIASNLGVKEEDVRIMEKRFSDNELSFDPSNEDESNINNSPQIMASKTEEPQSALETKQIQQARSILIKTALATLPLRTQKILKSRWLSEDKPRTLAELAQDFQISPERVRQIEASALKKLKNHLSNREFFEDYL